MEYISTLPGCAVGYHYKAFQWLNPFCIALAEVSPEVSVENHQRLLKPGKKLVHHKRPNPRKILCLHKKNEKSFQGFHIRTHWQKKNTKVDELAKAAAQKTPLPTYEFFQTIEDASIKTVEPEPRWINVIEWKTGEHL
jgi:hypothetical protein